jgi:two-component system LytT family response regulator
MLAVMRHTRASNRWRPLSLFLEIQMPGGTGFDLLARIDCVPRVIFTTAYDRYAVKAFDVNALDYLLKPIESERLAAA